MTVPAARKRLKTMRNKHLSLADFDDALNDLHRAVLIEDAEFVGIEAMRRLVEVLEIAAIGGGIGDVEATAADIVRHLHAAGEPVAVDLAGIHRSIADHHDSLFEEGELVRILKISEEAGEVAQAWIGHTGANKRKGRTHGPCGIAKELADVAITALVALHDWRDNPVQYLNERIAHVAQRVKESGS